MAEEKKKKKKSDIRVDSGGTVEEVVSEHSSMKKTINREVKDDFAGEDGEIADRESEKLGEDALVKKKKSKKQMIDSEAGVGMKEKKSKKDKEAKVGFEAEDVVKKKKKSKEESESDVIGNSESPKVCEKPLVRSDKRKREDCDLGAEEYTDKEMVRKSKKKKTSVDAETSLNSTNDAMRKIMETKSSVDPEDDNKDSKKHAEKEKQQIVDSEVEDNNSTNDARKKSTCEDSGVEENDLNSTKDAKKKKKKQKKKESEVSEAEEINTDGNDAKKKRKEKESEVSEAEENNNDAKKKRKEKESEVPEAEENNNDAKKKKKKKKQREVSEAEENNTDGNDAKKKRSEESGDEENKKRKKKKQSEVIIEAEENNTDGNDAKKKKKKNKQREVSEAEENNTDGNDAKKKSSEESEAEENKNDAKKKRKKKKQSEVIIEAEENNTDGNDAKKKQERGQSDKDVTSPSSKSTKRVKFSDSVEYFPAEDEETEEDKEEVTLVRGKRFTEEEDELVKKAVLEYVDNHALGDDGIKMVMECKSHPQLKGCWKEIASALPWRAYDSVYHRAHTIFEEGSKGVWTQEDLELVIEFQKKHGNDWRTLADAMGKNRKHVKDTWRRMRLASKKKGHWTREEYQNLFDLVNKDIRMKAFQEKHAKHGMLKDNIPWMAISDVLATRDHVACCSKWYDQLTSPMVANGTWANVDDYRLLEELLKLDAACIDDVDWDYLLENRDGEACRKRWNQMVLHIGLPKSKTFLEQVEILSERYCPDIAEDREDFDNRPYDPED